jgi:hypothetical protein
MSDLAPETRTDRMEHLISQLRKAREDGDGEDYINDILLCIEHEQNIIDKMILFGIKHISTAVKNMLVGPVRT